MPTASLRTSKGNLSRKALAELIGPTTNTVGHLWPKKSSLHFLHTLWRLTTASQDKKTEATEADTRSSAAFQCLKGVYRKDEEQHFIREWSNKTRGNSFKIKQDRFRLDIQKKIFTQRMVRNCNRLAREVVGALSLEVFKARLEAALGNLI